VVVSIVVKAHPKVTVSALNFNYTTSSVLSSSTFWSSIRVYFKYLVQHSDHGIVSYFRITGGNTSETFQMQPLWAPNMTRAQLEQFVSPYLNELRALGVPFDPVFYEHDNFRDAWLNRFPNFETGGKFVARTASRFVPRDNLEGEKFNRTFTAVRNSVLAGGRLLAYGLKGAPPGGYPSNAVHPGWRDAAMFAIMANPWDANATDSEIALKSAALTNDYMKYWRDVTPGGGTYMNEADINEQDWQQSFYGNNYPKLLEIKRKYDPTELLLGHHLVGWAEWYVTGQMQWLPTSNGRLCRKL
jgi:hypothetical protein